MAEQTRSEHMSSDFDDLRDTIQRSRTAIMFMGVALILLGLIAIAYPLATTIIVKLMIGWLFLIAGISQIIFAFSTGRWSDFFLELLMGLVFTIIGGWLAFFPLTGVLTLTLVIAVAFIVQGILEIFAAIRLRSVDGWLWLLFAGIVAIAVGTMILAEFPSSAGWAIGLLAGVSLIATGAAYVGLASSARRLESRLST